MSSVYFFDGCTVISACVLNKLCHFLVTPLPALCPTQLPWNHWPKPPTEVSRLPLTMSFPVPAFSSRQQLPLAPPKFWGLMPTWLQPLVAPPRADSNSSYQPHTSVNSLLSSEPSFAFSSGVWISVLGEAWRTLPWQSNPPKTQLLFLISAIPVLFKNLFHSH